MAEEYQSIIFDRNCLIFDDDRLPLLGSLRLAYRQTASLVLRNSTELDQWRDSRRVSTHFCVLTSLLLAQIYGSNQVLVASDEVVEHYFGEFSEDHYWNLFPVWSDDAVALRANPANLGTRGVILRERPELTLKVRLATVDLTRDQFGVNTRPQACRVRRADLLLAEGLVADDTRRRLGILGQAVREKVLGFDQRSGRLSPALGRWLDSSV